MTSSFQLSYWFQGLIPSGFRLMNVLLHGLASVLVYFTAQLLFGADKVKLRAKSTAPHFCFSLRQQAPGPLYFLSCILFTQRQ